MSDYYAYIFVRQDISKEQQLIQFGHVCCVLGNNLSHQHDPHSLNFVGIGVPNEEALYDVFHDIRDASIPLECFHEPDIGDEMTAVATHPVKGSARNLFKKHDLLSFA